MIRPALRFHPFPSLAKVQIAFGQRPPSHFAPE